jgi:hypothetical protein
MDCYGLEAGDIHDSFSKEEEKSKVLKQRPYSSLKGLHVDKNQAFSSEYLQREP